jgi:phospholipase/carboxylesterase
LKPLETVTVETGSNPAYTIIWMHGLGADGHDFEPLVPELQAGLPALRFVFPHAPVRPVTINNGYAMRAWYDIIGIDRRSAEDFRGIAESADSIGGLIHREHARGISSDRILLAGFSQGGAIALHTGLRHPRKLAGVMALSTYLPLAESLPSEGSAANKTTPVFMAHGLFDNVVPLMMGAGSMTFLTGLGYSIEWRQYPMQHSVCPEEIKDIGTWLRRVLKT